MAFYIGKTKSGRWVHLVTDVGNRALCGVRVTSGPQWTGGGMGLCGRCSDTATRLMRAAA